MCPEALDFRPSSVECADRLGDGRWAVKAKRHRLRTISITDASGSPRIDRQLEAAAPRVATCSDSRGAAHACPVNHQARLARWWYAGGSALRAQPWTSGDTATNEGTAIVRLQHSRLCGTRGGSVSIFCVRHLRPPVSSLWAVATSSPYNTPGQRESASTRLLQTMSHTWAKAHSRNDQGAAFVVNSIAGNTKPPLIRAKGQLGAIYDSTNGL